MTIIIKLYFEFKGLDSDSVMLSLAFEAKVIILQFQNGIIHQYSWQYVQ